MSDTHRSRERYTIIGTGGRAHMYIDAIRGAHSPVAELVAWSDTNPGRLDFYERELAADGAAAPARFEGVDLARVVDEQRIDRVIVTSPDFTHADLVSRALRAGADVVVEKPITIDVAGLRQIRAAMTERPIGRHDVQLSVQPPQQRAARTHRRGVHRRRDIRPLRMGARHRARSGLLQTLAPGEGALRRAAYPQGVASLRSRELVDRREPDPSVRERRPAFLRSGQRGQAWPRPTPGAR